MQFDLSDSDDDAIFLTEIRRLFDHASGGDQEVTAYELRDIFNKIFSQGYYFEFCVDVFVYQYSSYLQQYVCQKIATSTLTDPL